MFWKMKEQTKIEGLAWFRYAIMLPDMEDAESELTIIGNFIIKNTGNKILNNPMICIRTKPTQEVRLGGKIGSKKHTALMMDGTNTESWQYVHDDWKKRTNETGEHWLKPNQCKQDARKTRRTSKLSNLLSRNKIQIPISIEERIKMRH